MTPTPTLGQKLTPILEEIEDTLWEHEANIEIPLEFDEEALRAAIKIFTAVIFDRMWENKNYRSEEFGLAVKVLVKEFTGVDTTKLYK